MTRPKVANSKASAVEYSSLNRYGTIVLFSFVASAPHTGSLLASLYVANEQYLWMTEDIYHFAPFLR